MEKHEDEFNSLSLESVIAKQAEEIANLKAALRETVTSYVYMKNSPHSIERMERIPDTEIVRRFCLKHNLNPEDFT